MFRYIGVVVRALDNFKRYCSSSGGCLRQPCTKISVLPNGMRVATEVSDSPLACVALFVEAGPVSEKPTNYGITHFIEHMAYRGFKSMNKQQLEDYLTNIGAKMTVSTTREFQVFSAKCPSANVSDVISILSKIVTELELSQAELEMAKCMIELESSDADNNHKLVVSDFIHETAFQCTPLSRRIMGTSKNIKKFNKNTVECFTREYYYPAKFVLATSGAINHDSIVSDAQTYFGNMNTTCGVNYCPPQRFTGSQIIYRNDSMPFVHMAIAVEAPGFRSPDYLTMLLASNIIGSWSKSQYGRDTHGSALARAAATSELCDSFESFYIPYKDVGLWGIYIVGAKMDISDMIYNVQDQWMNLCTTTIFNDVQRSINTTKLELAKRIEGSVKSCYDLGTRVLYNCERRTLSHMNMVLSRANKKIVRKIASKYIYDRCPVVAAVGPTEVVPDYTRIRAGMYWLRL